MSVPIPEHMLPTTRHVTGTTRLLGTPSFDDFEAGFLDTGLLDAGFLVVTLPMESQLRLQQKGSALG